MNPLRQVTGRAAVLDRPDIDTDQIIPKQFLKRIERSGYGEFLFYDWMKDPEFELRRPEYEGAQILVAGRNFGCGSSREHAAWALADAGFRAILAPSFADIFFNNCCQNGLLPVRLEPEEIDQLVHRVQTAGGQYRLTVDLEEQVVEDGHGFRTRFALEPYRREMLLRGLDEIGHTLLEEPRIAAFEQRRTARAAAAP